MWTVETWNSRQGWAASISSCGAVRQDHCRAIHYAHQRGTLHRDLKPQNVLIDTADQPRITDFGLAKLMKDDSQITHTGMVMGSPSYMPPEQAAGRQADLGPTSDVYSLGAMLYELLTVRLLFAVPPSWPRSMKVLETEPTALRKLKIDIAVDLETITLKCLEKLPSARYPSARALAEETRPFSQKANQFKLSRRAPYANS